MRCASARSRASRPSPAAAERAVGVGVVLEHAPHDVEGDARAGAITADAAEELVVAHPALRPSGCTSTGTNAPSSRRARQTVTRRPVECRPRADVRRERADAAPGVDRVGEIELAVGGARSSRRRSCLPRAAARTRARAARRRAAVRRPRPSARRSCPRRRRARSGSGSCAATGPASSASTVSWIVTPVSLVAGEDRALDRRGAAPARQKRGMHVQPERLREQRRGM